MLSHFFVEHPSPIRAGVYTPDQQIPAALPTGLAGGSMWSGLSIAARMGHGFAYYRRFVDSPHFARDVRAAFIINLGEMADVLERQKGGGNWETQMASSLLAFGLTYPEFRGAKRWAQQGLDTVVHNALSTVRPDGCLQEPTINYHLFVMGMYVGFIERARALKLPVPDEMVRLVERMHEYVMYAALPDGSLPLWGDSNPPTDAASLERGAGLFGRDDFRFVGTNGEQGRAPAETSRGFVDGGFYYMRSGWEPEAQYMGLRCGPHGSHGHADALSLIVSAFGRLVLIDPGVYIYGTPECAELAATRSHNTVTVDDADAVSAVCDAWVTSERFDYFEGHNEGYRGVDRVGHRRRVWFLRGFAEHAALWVVLDDVTGEGEHAAALRYRFAPMAVSHDPSALTVRTDASPGLQVVVAQGPGITLTVGEGIAAASWESLAKASVAAFEQRGALPLAFSSVLVPYTAQPPAVHIEALPTDAPGVHALWLTVDEEAVAALGGPLATQRTTVLPDGRRMTATGGEVALRFQRARDEWQPYAVCGVDVQSVTLDDRVLVAGAELQDAVDRLLP
jgi:hypothetical protein